MVSRGGPVWYGAGLLSLWAQALQGSNPCLGAIFKENLVIDFKIEYVLGLMEYEEL